jgi:hypothetical protein
MGKEIAYCTGCGILLRERDFECGLAHTVDHRLLCPRCRPLATPTLPVHADGPVRARSRTRSA